MATLETQYKTYLEENSNIELTFEDWYDKVYIPKILLFKKQMQKDAVDEDLKDWDNTLMDGLEDLPWDENINKDNNE